MTDRPQAVSTILVVDGDVGFLAYLCMTLTQAGYVVLPATNAERVQPLLKELNIPHVDVLVVNPKMAGGIELARKLSRQGAKVIAIEIARRSEFQAFQVVATLRRAEERSPAVEQEWLRNLRAVLGEGQGSRQL